jgi:hypothetical protein
MIESVHFHRGYSLRLHKSKPFINYGIISSLFYPGTIGEKSSVNEAPHLQNAQIMPVPEQVGKTFFGATTALGGALTHYPEKGYGL